MADYKDIITGTLNSLIGKVKDVTESGTVRSVYDKGANRAKAYARIAKLTLELNGENEELKKVYTEIGRLYYEQAKDAPEGFFASLFSQVDEITGKIVAKQEEIDSLKAEASENVDDVQVEFEEVVAETEDDGKNE